MEGQLHFSTLGGQNQKLTFGGIIGKETSYFLDFQDPWITGDHVSLSGTVYQILTKNPFYLYIYKERGFSISTGFYKNKYHKIKL